MSQEPSVTRSKSMIKTLFFADCESNGNSFSIQQQHPVNQQSNVVGAPALMVRLVRANGLLPAGLK